MNNSWYYIHDGARKGPVSPDEIQLALVRGEVDRQSLVWREGMVVWQMLESVEDLQPMLEHTPPPLPLGPPPLPSPPLEPAPPPPKAPVSTAAVGDTVTNSSDRTGPGEERSETDRRRSPRRAKRVLKGWLDATAEWLGRTTGHALWQWFSTRSTVTVVIMVLTPFLVGTVTYAVIINFRSKPPVVEATGQVRIDANPWGQVEWIRGPGGINIDLPSVQTTPLVMTLPVGDYQVQVTYPHAQASERCDLRVRPAQLATCWLNLAPVDAKAYLQRIGW